MDRRIIGGTGGLSVSLVGLGCNAFGKRVDEKGTHAVMDAAIGAGIDFALSKQAKLGFGYIGQFGDGVSQNSINARLNVSF